MTTDLLFMPTLPQKPPSSLQCEKTGLFSPDPSSKTDKPGLSEGDKHENFLTTLRQASRDRNPSEGSRQLASPAVTRSDNTDLYPEIEQGIDLESVSNDALVDILALLGQTEVFQNHQTPVAVELTEIASLLEKLGLNDSSAERMLLSAARLTDENMSNPAGKNQNRLAALKQLIAEVQPNDPKPGNDLSQGPEGLRSFIANVLAADTSVHNPGNPKDEFNLNQASGPVDLVNWAKGINQGQENVGNVNVVLAGEGAGGEKSAEILSAVTRPAMETEYVLKASGSTKPVENAPIPLSSENPEKTDTAKLNPDMRVAVDGNETPKETKVSEKMPGHGPVNDAESEMPVKARNSNWNAHFSRSLTYADSGRPSGGEPLQETSLAGDSSPVSKLTNDVQVAKESPFKVDTAPGDNAGSKVVKLEAGTNDNGQLTSQSQTLDKTLESTPAPKEAEAGQRELRTQTMEQIVRRAVIQVRDGQHEARIDLKPDFMGHVRMQVITENQQVTVKILTEFGFVKDLIENNIQQLKADLQNQGLDVDKLDVSVSRDSHDNKHRQQNAEHARNLRHQDKSSDHGNSRDEHQEQARRSAPSAEGLSTVDYFA
jgi:flagellar hook-length control protein FliK